jgi:hypothetical protein
MFSAPVHCGNAHGTLYHVECFQEEIFTLCIHGSLCSFCGSSGESGESGHIQARVQGAQRRVVLSKRVVATFPCTHRTTCSREAFQFVIVPLP